MTITGASNSVLERPHQHGIHDSLILTFEGLNKQQRNPSPPHALFEEVSICSNGFVILTAIRITHKLSLMHKHWHQFLSLAPEILPMLAHCWQRDHENHSLFLNADTSNSVDSASQSLLRYQVMQTRKTEERNTK
ncbi:hypothetical protein AMTR_s00007p00259230, partial [Amborella trichopoda]